MAYGVFSVSPSGLEDLLIQRLPQFAALRKSHQHHIVKMLWDFANNRYRHSEYQGAAFPVKYMDELWGNRRIRNRIVSDYFSNTQGDNISHLMSSYTPKDFLGKVLVEFLEDPTPIDLLVDGKRMKMPPNPILSRAASEDPEVTYAKKSKWQGVSPSPLLPIKQEALCAFSRKTADAMQRMSALRLLKLSRNTMCSGEIPVLYEQKSTGRLTEVLFGLQNNEREVISAALHGMWDYDLQNAHFSIFSAWAKKLGHATPVVDEYVKNKAQIRRELTEHCQSNLNDIKQCLLALLYGAPLNANPKFASIPRHLGVAEAKLFINHPFVRSLKQEISFIGKYIVEDTYTSRGCYVNAMGIEPPNIGGKTAKFNLLSHALQGVEALTLKTVVAQHSQDILLCMHDGWVSRTKLDCNQLQDSIFRVTGFDLGIEEVQLPKYMPIEGDEPAWPFSDSSPVQRGSLIISASSDWNTKDGVRGRVTRPDTKFRNNAKS
jgi:hypothetical protein